MAGCCSTMPSGALSKAGRFEIRLQTNQAFAANLELYAKLGYAIDRTEPFRGGTLVFMSKRLSRFRRRGPPRTDRPTRRLDGSRGQFHDPIR